MATLTTASGSGTFWSRFGIDPRSLALFRMAAAGILLADLGIRAGDLKVMYTDDGMFPRSEIFRLFKPVWNWSFHLAGGAWQIQAVLMGIAAVLALALLLGFKTRVATIGSWLMLISIHHRVPPVISGAEILLRLLLFWAMFLPLGRVWSLDSVRARRRGQGDADGLAPVVSAGSVAILSQMGLMYVFSAYFKTNAQWTGGTALAGVFAHDFYAAPAGVYLLQFPELLNVLTRCTLAVEWAGPLLLFLTRNPWIRLAAIGVLAALHIGIGICLEVGLFPYVALAGLTLFLPRAFWESRMLRCLPRPARQTGETHPAAVSYAGDLWQRTCLICFFYVLLANLNSFRSRPLASLSPESWTPMARGLGLGQSWGMFEEVPSKDGWYVAWAKLKDGSEVDLLRKGAPVDGTRPEFPARLYPNHYWQKLFREMAYTDAKGYQFFREPVARYLIRQWNGEHGPEKTVAEFEFIYSMENANATGAGGRTPDREVLLHLDLP